MEVPGSWYPGSWHEPPQKLGPGSWDMVGTPYKLGVWVVAARRKLEVDACSPQKAGCPSKLPFQAQKAGFKYMFLVVLVL